MSLYSARLLLSLTLIIGVVAGCGCNGDDPPKPPLPTGVIAVNGEFYKGTMGGDLLDQPLEFGVKNSGGDFVADQWIHFSLLEGDGDLSADSLKSGANGLVTLGYNFSDSLGYATIRAIARNLDTTDVYLRANVLIPGDHGQGQYVLLDDTYGDVVDFNGPPASFDPAGLVVVANYEAALGMIVLVYDTNEDGVIERNSPVYLVAVMDSVFLQPPDSNTVNVRYEGATVDGLGIGSHWWNDFIPIYGNPSPPTPDDSDPNLPSHKVQWPDLHLTLWCHKPVTVYQDSTVYQIDIAEEFDVSLYEAPPLAPAIDSVMLLIGR